jgi:hypothetical protein
MNSGFTTATFVITAEDLHQMEADEPRRRAAMAARIRDIIPEPQRIAHFVEMSVTRLIAQHIRDGAHDQDEFLLKLQEKLNKEFFR